MANHSSAGIKQRPGVEEGRPVSPLQAVVGKEEFVSAIRQSLLDGTRSSSNHFAGSSLPGNVSALHRYGATLRQFERELVPLGFEISTSRGQVQFIAPPEFLPGSNLRFAYFSGSHLDLEDSKYLGEDALHVNRKGISTRIAIQRQGQAIEQRSLFDDFDEPARVERVMFIIVDYHTLSFDGLPLAWLAYPAKLNAEGTAIFCEELALLDLSMPMMLKTTAPAPAPVEVKPILADIDSLV